MRRCGSAETIRDRRRHVPTGDHRAGARPVRIDIGVPIGRAPRVRDLTEEAKVVRRRARERTRTRWVHLQLDRPQLRGEQLDRTTQAPVRRGSELFGDEQCAHHRGDRGVGGAIGVCGTGDDGVVGPDVLADEANGELVGEAARRARMSGEVQQERLTRRLTGQAVHRPTEHVTARGERAVLVPLGVETEPTRLAVCDGPSRQQPGDLLHIGLVIAAVDADGVEFEEFARVVLDRLAGPVDPRERLVEVEEHRRGLRRCGEHVGEPTRRMTTDHVAVVGRLVERARVVVHVDVEVVRPEVDEQFVELPRTPDGTHEGRRGEVVARPPLVVLSRERGRIPSGSGVRRQHRLDGRVVDRLPVQLLVDPGLEPDGLDGGDRGGGLPERQSASRVDRKVAIGHRTARCRCTRCRRRRERGRRGRSGRGGRLLRWCGRGSARRGRHRDRCGTCAEQQGASIEGGRGPRLLHPRTSMSFVHGVIVHERAVVTDKGNLQISSRCCGGGVRWPPSVGT